MNISSGSPAVRWLVAAATVATLGLGTVANTTVASAQVPVESGTASAPASLGSRVDVGAYVAGMDTNPALLSQFDQTISRPTTVASIFRGYGEVFPSASDIALTDNGRRSLLVAWYLDVDRFTGFTAGNHDAVLNQEAAAIRSYDGLVYIRPWAEMNGDWSTFQPTASGSAQFGGTPVEFIAAWRHVVDTFRAAGATNVRWVFNPTSDTYAETTDVRTIWPGSSYVDVLGLDGYNWGDGNGLTWTAFGDIFYEQYTRLTDLDPTAPVWICEFGSKEALVDDGVPADTANSKAQWYTDALAITAFPRITTLVAFDADKERDWRIDSSPAVPVAIRAGLGQ